MSEKNIKSKSSIQLRDANSADKRWWSPDRDITVLFPKIIREVFYELSKDDQHAEVVSVRKQLQIPDSEIRLAAKVYARIVRCVLSRGEDLRNALQKSKFTTLRVNALLGMLVLERMTKLFVDMYGATLHKGEWDPNHEDLSNCLAALEEFDSKKD